MRKVDTYGSLPRLSDKIRKRRMTMAGHNVRHPELVASGLVLWEPGHVSCSVGGRRTTLFDVLKWNTGLEVTTEVRTLMEDRLRWRAAIHIYRVGVG